MARLTGLLSLFLLAACGACSADDGGTAGPARDPGAANASGGSGAGGISLGGAGGSAGVETCAAKSEQAELIRLPVDIIIVADTTNSMGSVTSAIELNINTKFADVLKKEKLDYRVVLVASYGDGARICVTAPLGSGSCSPVPATPTQVPGFLHYDQGISSKTFFTNILGSYNAPDAHGLAPGGWSTFLRADAMKVFLGFTDAQAGPSTPGATFDSQLLALTPALFGTAEARNYIFHSFVGVAAQADPTKAWLPSDPIAPAGCGYPPGKPLQDLSILTGGLRFPLCQTQNYDAVFQAVADDLIKKVTVSCDVPFPEPPVGETLDPNTIQVEFTHSGGSTETFGQVKTEAECTATSFYVDQNKVHLCAAACTSVQADPEAVLEISFGCDVGFVK